MQEEPLILHSDNHVLGLCKPAGMPVVPDASGDYSLLDWAKDWIKTEFQKPGAVYLGVVHRLDRPVSGTVVFARTSKGAARLSAQWKNRDVRKIYWGMTSHPPQREDGVLEQWLQKDRAKNLVRVVPAAKNNLGKTSSMARTRWRILKSTETQTWLELEPHTGRPHQLRVACRSLGSPLLGDVKYGARNPLRDGSIALHARELRIKHPTREELLRLCSPLPKQPWWSLTNTTNTS